MFGVVRDAPEPVDPPRSRHNPRSGTGAAAGRPAASVRSGTIDRTLGSAPLHPSVGSGTLGRRVGSGTVDRIDHAHSLSAVVAATA